MAAQHQLAHQTALHQPPPQPPGPLSRGVHWLMCSHHDHLFQYGHGTHDARRIRDLEVQLFVFHQGRVLLLQPEGKEVDDEWTAPSKIINVNAVDHPGPQAVFKIAIRMLRHAIEERTLVGLQFPEINTGQNYVFDQWRAEHDSNTKTLHLNIIVTVESSTLDKNCAINYPTKYTKKRWLKSSEISQLKQGRVLDRVKKTFELLAKFSTFQDNLIASLDYRILESLCLSAAHFKLQLQVVDCCQPISHALMLVRQVEQRKDDQREDEQQKDEQPSPLFIMDVAKEISDQITHKDHEIVTAIPLPGGCWDWKETRYVVVGKVVDEHKNFAYCPGVEFQLLRGMLGKDGRLNIEWMLWNKGVRLEMQKTGASNRGRYDSLFQNL